MSDSFDDDLPDVADSLRLPESPSKTHKVTYKINLKEEIIKEKKRIQTEQKRFRVSEETSKSLEKRSKDHQKFEKDLISGLTKIEAVPDEAPGREFFRPEAAFCQFNAESLVKPFIIQHISLHDLLPFYQDIRTTLQDLTASESDVEESQEVLQYVLFLASVHPDELIVECCTELLLEFNNQWEINHKLLLAVFQNWGADINQVLPAYPSVPVRINPGKPQTVPLYNVNAVLEVLTEQLKLRKRIDRYGVITEFGLWSIDELVFSLLILLSLDTKFVGCIPVLQECVGELLTGVSEITGGNWASDYSLLLLGLEEDNYNLTQLVSRVLIGTPASESLQLNVCFAGVQRVRGISPIRINHQFNFDRLETLIYETTVLAQHDSLDIYTLLLFIDTIVRHPKVTSEETFRRFYQWLTRLERRVTANAHISALISNLSTLWDRQSPAI